jgi:hypothetical protein
MNFFKRIKFNNNYKKIKIMMMISIIPIIYTRTTIKKKFQCKENTDINEEEINNIETLLFKEKNIQKSKKVIKDLLKKYPKSKEVEILNLVCSLIYEEITLESYTQKINEISLKSDLNSETYYLLSLLYSSTVPLLDFNKSIDLCKKSIGKNKN